MAGRQDKKTPKRPKKGSKSSEKKEATPAPSKELERAGLASPAGRQFLDAITDEMTSDAGDALALLVQPSDENAAHPGINLRDIGLPMRTRATTQKVDLTGFIDSGAETGDVEETLDGNVEGDDEREEEDEDEGEDDEDAEVDPDPTSVDDEETQIDKPRRPRIPRDDTIVDEPPKGGDDER